MGTDFFEQLRHIFRFKRYVYLDHNATTYVSKRVRKIMKRVLKYYWGNPSSAYRLGKMSAQIIEEARQQVADEHGQRHDQHRSLKHRKISEEDRVRC